MFDAADKLVFSFCLKMQHSYGPNNGKLVWSSIVRCLNAFILDMKLPILCSIKKIRMKINLIAVIFWYIFCWYIFSYTSWYSQHVNQYTFQINLKAKQNHLICWISVNLNMILVFVSQIWLYCTGIIYQCVLSISLCFNKRNFWSLYFTGLWFLWVFNKSSGLLYT